MPPRMKSIELQGYKTFANKVFFEFPLPITAIVGPNGSGKSNISDAIRWVLGEQSYLTLRGRRTTDMIFSGSDKKARANMASATITFDNADHWLPMDYVEVAITRRAYRDGQNEYLINGQKVRLKDVNEMLAQSGLSERTYTIIGQGLIDSALSASPEDRRKFFEEAAGIGLFRSRREEALIRLKETAHNLERINDILSELEPRVHSLERQAKRAAEYGHVTDELKHLLREWYGYHWHHAQQDLLVVRERYAQQEKRTEQVRSQFEEFDKNLQKKRNEINELRIKLSELHKKAAEIHKRIEQFTRENAILDERKNSLLAQTRSHEDEFAALSEEMKLILSRRNELSVSLESLQNEEKDAIVQKDYYTNELNNRIKKTNDLRTELRSKRDDQNKVESQLIRLKARRDDLNERINKQEELVPSLQITLDRLETGLRTFQADNQKFYDAHRQNEEKRSLLQSEILEIEKELNEKESSLRDLRIEKNRNDADLSRVSARLDVLNDAEKHLSGMNRGAQYIAKAAEKGIIKGAIRSLQSLLSVPKEYENAVASALGDELDAVLLDIDEWENIMTLLNQDQNGRAVLLSESSYGDIPYSEKFAADESLIPLISVVNFSEEMHSIVIRVFSGVWLADSRKRAMELQPQLQPGQRIVTMEGDLFRADGSAVSGSEGKQKILSRTREINELELNKTQIVSIIQSFEEKINSADKEISLLRERLKSHQNERTKVQSSAVELQKKLNQLAVEKEKQTQSAAFQRQRIVDTKSQIEKDRKQIQEISGQINNLEKSRDSFQTEIKQIQDQINKIQIGELQDQVQHWNVNCAVLRKSIAEMESRIKDNFSENEKNQRKQELLQEKIKKSEVNTLDLDKQILLLREKSESENQQAVRITEETNPVEAALKTNEEALNQLQKSFQEKQQVVLSNERLLAQAQVDVTRHDDKLESLKKKIEDDLGMVNFIYDEKIEGQNTLPLGDLVSELPKIEILSENLEEQIQRLKNHLRRLGAVNTDAITEFAESSQRYEFLRTQMADLKKADADLRQVITELDRMMENAFLVTFDKVQIEFKKMFVRLFGGGSARLVLTDPNDVNNSGIEIEAKLPGHKEQELSLLSGGERSLTSVALVFSLLRVSPTPFCVMDEVDAALDEANVGRFCDLLKELSAETQFLLITHNRNTVETSDVIYGITMASDSTSQVVSLRLDEIKGDILK